MRTGADRQGAHAGRRLAVAVDERGAREFEALMGAPAADVLADIRAISPGMYEAVVSRAFGGTLANPISTVPLASS